MLLFYRGQVLARLPIAHPLASWPRLSQQAWPQPSFLVIARSLCSATCPQATLTQHLMPLTNARLSQSQLLLRRGAHISWSHCPGIRVGRFNSMSPSAQAKRSKPSHRSGGNTQVPKAFSQLIKETLIPRMPTISKHSGPIEVLRPTTQASSTSKKQRPPRAGFNSFSGMLHCLRQFHSKLCLEALYVAANMHT